MASREDDNVQRVEEVILHTVFSPDFFSRIDWSQYVSLLKKRRSPSADVVDFSSTTWGKMLSNPEVRDVNSSVGKLFRRRFRIPFPLFELLTEMCAIKNIFESKSADREKIPIVIKLLVCLRILARDECADTVSELSHVGMASLSFKFVYFR